MWRGQRYSVCICVVSGSGIDNGDIGGSSESVWNTGFSRPPTFVKLANGTKANTHLKGGLRLPSMEGPFGGLLWFLQQV